MTALALTANVARGMARHATGMRSAVLQVGGLIGFTTAAWMAHTIAGIAVGSVACFVLNWLLTDPAEGRH